MKTKTVGGTVSRFLSAIALGVLIVADMASAGELRQWTDVQGRQVEAEYAGVTAGKVNLKLPGGRWFPFRLSN